MEIKISQIINLNDYDYGDFGWIEYIIENSNKYGYIKILGDVDEDIAYKALNATDMYKRLVKKMDISCTSNYLRDLIESCKDSDCDMWFVDSLEDIPGKNNSDKLELICELENEVKKLGLQEYIDITLEENETLVTVYGGIITKFLF